MADHGLTFCDIIISEIITREDHKETRFDHKYTIANNEIKDDKEKNWTVKNDRTMNIKNRNKIKKKMTHKKTPRRKY